MSFRTFLLVSATVLMFAGGSATAGTQQEKMKTCNAEASKKELKGDDRRQFMSQCLRKDAGDDRTAQQDKMVSCNREASDKHLTGDQRRAYMSDCLRAEKGGPRTSAAGGR
jgi:hypothetical protein